MKNSRPETIIPITRISIVRVQSIIVSVQKSANDFLCMHIIDSILKDRYTSMYTILALALHPILETSAIMYFQAQ